LARIISAHNIDMAKTLKRGIASGGARRLRQLSAAYRPPQRRVRGGANGYARHRWLRH